MKNYTSRENYLKNKTPLTMKILKAYKRDVHGLFPFYLTFKALSHHPYYTFVILYHYYCC